MTAQELWVFGYGSLIWDPGFPVAERRIARLKEYARSFCMRSIHHRGTEEDPGLVLALDAHAGAACEGVAFRVTPGAHAPTMEYLRERELISSAYLERVVELRLDDGRQVDAVAYVMDRDHPQYVLARDLSHPLIVAGGPCAVNPEPMSAFIDCFVIGDGEELFPKICRHYVQRRSEGLRKPKF